MAEQEIATRVPPGDRWKIVGSDVLYLSLTEALNSIYLEHKVSDFHIDAKKGVIFIDDGVVVEPVIETFDLYGER
jgi:hypothetical protein|tara:strand:+ start:457 stop:681 length:225 start_codon:yes stop_codon:yes gene_type:complete